MLIISLAKQQGHLLTPTDRRLVSALQTQPLEATFWSAAELTGPLQLHQSAATRLAQRLGFEGYPQLRDALRADYHGGDGPSQRIRGRLERHQASDVLGGFVDDELAALSDLPRHVQQGELDALAEQVLRAGEVHLFAQGNATVLVDLMSRRLQRFGMRTVQLTGSRRDIAERIARLSAGDLLLAFAFRRAPAVLGPLLDVAAEAGAHSALITDTVVWPAPRPSTIIAAPRGGSDDYLSLTVPMAISNALILTIARRAEPSLRSLDRLGTLLDRLDS
ncbi:MurR/RpiR family transcriptional regulator [Pseudoclavibacter sp. VKM Ac-2888]|uniref:MurR/RpiR family transcriptional regulator n=1 Tax=Pseudoclavibacter sp. VKM Ac-2888 TaxID=2783830 RepID=UPI00188A65B4|nr:MurR/RpiR family transcriptional regulator [Pseudoclavibacter sp. VKM Ac-2888]MBF4550983.1 MurR/RpiR family transcriptional regulator [Pseudoclavibacter sp. VKM Ac-2888]